MNVIKSCKRAVFDEEKEDDPRITEIVQRYHDSFAEGLRGGDEQSNKRRAKDGAASQTDDGKASKASEAVRKEDDPFLYYSSDKRRMEYLLGRELPEMPTEEDRPTKRKTAISFELDPLYDLMSSFPELFDE